jgi:similar to stage IV sporulation protein
MSVMSNYVKCRITGSDKIRFLNLCGNNGIELKQVTLVDDSLQMEIDIRDFRKLRPLIRKTHVRVHILNRQGPAFLLYRHRKRLWFAFGLASLAGIVWYLSLFIWQIDINGNQMYTDNLILQSLRTMNVDTGCKKSELDLASIEEELRIMYNQITWVSASVTGTVLHIELKEGNLQSEASEGESEIPSDLTADVDATITDIVVRHGTAVVHAGDEVREGDLLVEGRVYIYNDDETLKKIDYLCADADILAEYELVYQKDYERQYEAKNYLTKTHRSYYLQLSGLYLQWPDGYQMPEYCEKWTWEKRFRLTSTFYLPLTVGIEEYKPYEITEESYTDSQLQEMASKDLDSYIDELVKKGVQIIRNSVKITLDDRGSHAAGLLTVQGPVGVSAPIEVSGMAFEPSGSGK